MRNGQIWPEWIQEEEIGSGTFGTVYKVRKEQYGITSYAAVKVIEIPQNQSEIRELQNQGLDGMSITAYYNDAVKSLLSEIRIMESLKGAGNIVTIEDCAVTEHEKDQGYTIYIRMELLKSLSVYQAEHPMGATEVVQLGKDICDALTCCQQEHIIHRDIKPDNIFINKYGTFKLGDFGISRQLERTRSAVSQKGTNQYMAPEVFRGEHYTHVVDIYSLGIMLYRLLNNGRFPFMPPAPQPLKYDDAQKALMRRMNGEPLENPVHADETLSQIIRKAAALSPAMRYQSAEEMKRDLILWEQYNKKDAKDAQAHSRENQNQSQAKTPENDPYKTMRADTGVYENKNSFFRENIKDSRVELGKKSKKQTANAKNAQSRPKEGPQPQQTPPPKQSSGASKKPAPPKKNKKWVRNAALILAACFIGRMFGGYAAKSMRGDENASLKESGASAVSQLKKGASTIFGAQPSHSEASEKLWNSLDAYEGQIEDVNYYTSSLETLDQFFEQKDWISYDSDTENSISRFAHPHGGHIFILESNDERKSRSIELDASGFCEYSKEDDSLHLSEEATTLNWLLPDMGLWKNVSFAMKKEDLYDAFNLTKKISQTDSQPSSEQFIIDEWTDADDNLYEICIKQSSNSLSAETLTLQKHDMNKSFSFDFDTHGMLVKITMNR